MQSPKDAKRFNYKIETTFVEASGHKEENTNDTMQRLDDNTA